MHNEFDKNKRIFPEPCLITKSAPITLPIALPPAEDEGFDGHPAICGCKPCMKNKQKVSYLKFPNTGGKGPGQDGWESVDGVDEGPVQAMNNEGGPPIYVWPDGGINTPARARKPQLSLVSITEPKKKIEEDFQRTSIDKLAQIVEDAAEDDQNNWGGIEEILNNALAEGLRQAESATADEETKYGPGNYPDDDSYRTPEFFHNLFAKTESPFFWMVPNVLAIGPHPLFSSHLDSLNKFREAGFKAIVSVFDKQLDPKYVDGFHYLFMPTSEGFSADLKTTCNFIDTQESLGHPVFIHSFNSKGRAATIVAAYLVHKGWLTAGEAIEWVRQHYDESAIETTAQEDAVLKFAIDKP